MAKGNRKHIGVLCSTIDIACQYDVWKGIVEVAEANDMHLTAYIGTYQTTDNNFTSHMESCFDIMWGNDLLDGVIILSGFIAQNIGLEEFAKYAERIPKDIPVISVSIDIDGIPSVMTHNTSGMFSAVDHLIRVHEKKNIAFVKGPDGHPEAEARLQGYKDALEANNIPFDEKYLFPGDFGRDGGRNAVHELYDVRKLPADAFVCTNDQSAIGVLEKLKARNIMVPKDIALTGFDDDIVSSIYVPTITTVGQDFVKLGRVSAGLLLDRINGKEVDDITHITPELVVRQSCGCSDRALQYKSGRNESEAEHDTLYNYLKKGFIDLLQDVVPHEQIIRWVDILLVQMRVEPFYKDDFINALDRILVTYYHSYSREFSVWHKALIVLAMGVEQHKGDFAHAHTILSTITFATTLVYDIRINEERKREYGLNDDRMRKRRITNALLLMFDADTLADELYKSISGLSIKTALIGIYHKPVERNAAHANRSIETLIGFDGEDRFNIQHNSWSPIMFSDYSTIEGFDYYRERRVMYFQPLFFMDEEVGVMLLPFNRDISIDAYETLRINISTAIKGSQLLSTIHTLSITDELTGLYNRRGFFQFAYSRLQHLQRNTEHIPIVMFMDMDGLKFINDNHGHSEGDKAIEIFAGILKKTMREEDIIGRMGGDEFAVFSSVRDKENGKQLELRLRDAFEKYNNKNYHPYKIAASIGSVVLEESTKKCFEAAMLSADSVLYDEKIEKKKKGLTRA
ncbi:MAG: GGDEF domain-containing protein [Oscillospiraceae bacterium]|nr:GGDEF domain-containing protein [Oscillospiraceae bacterium]